MCDFVCNTVDIFRIILYLKKYLCSCVHVVFILHYKIYICIPIHITLTLEKTEGTIKNGQPRDTDNIGHTRDRTNNDRYYTMQQTELKCR